MVDWTRLGAMIRAGVDDAPIARVVGIPVSQLFTLVFCLGAALAAFGGVMGAPYLSVYPGLDADMLPLALIVVILGGTGSLLGAFVGSFIIGFLYNFGQALFPDLAYVILFLPMLLVLVLRPQGLFGTGRAVSRSACSARRSCVALVVLATRAGVGRQSVLHQHRQPDPDLGACSRSRSTCWSATAASSRSATPGCSPWPATPRACCSPPATAISLAIPRRSSPRSSRPALFAVLALRATGIGFLMITLALGQILWGIAYRWASLTNGDNGVNVRSRPAPFGLSLAGAPRSTTRRSSCSCSCSSAMLLFVRSPFGASLARHARPAAPHDALGYNVWLIRLLAFLFSGFWRRRGAAVRLLQPVHQPAGRRACRPPPRRC